MTLLSALTPPFVSLSFLCRNSDLQLTTTIERDPENYLSYYKRATAYLSLGRSNAAVDDFSRILDIKPDFDQALLQRARIYAKEGDFDLAQADLQKYVKAHPEIEEATELVCSL